MQEAVVAHAPGYNDYLLHKRDNPLWDAVRAMALRSAKPGKPLRSDCTIITWNSTNSVSPLERSLNRYQCPVMVLGKHLPRWRNRMKTALTLQAIKIIETKYLMGVDALDAVFVQHPNIAVERFQEMKCNMLLNGERTFSPSSRHPTIQHFRQYEESISPEPYLYLNMGAWIGKTQSCREFFEAGRHSQLPNLTEANTKNAKWVVSESEQALMHSVFVDMHPQVQIDYECRIFQGLCHETSATLGCGPLLL